jgi:hypothetical protein
MFLIGSLLFAQIAVNFFHNNHDVHQTKITPLKSGDAVQKHDEHCKVCAIDFFNHAFIPSLLLTVEHPVFNAHQVQFASPVERITTSYSQGRAPPLS